MDYTVRFERALGMGTMNLLETIRARFAAALEGIADDVAPLLALVRPSQDAKFGDYQANFAMPLGKLLGKPPRQVAEEIVAKLTIADLCDQPEVAGPGFINVRLKDESLTKALRAALTDARLGIVPVAQAKTFVVDYSGPNVAKPMHVGHIRSTVIGDAITRTLRFLGHNAISDNHIGDWGTQFGMILYGYKHLRDDAAYKKDPVTELGRLYRLVRQLMDYHDGVKALPQLTEKVAEQGKQLAQLKSLPAAADKNAQKDRAKQLRRAEMQFTEAQQELTELKTRIAKVEGDAKLDVLALAHPGVSAAALAETAQLHAGDAENLRLWSEFLPACREDIEIIYRRLGVTFDHALGESFYHDRLAAVVSDFAQRGLSRVSEGATCVFLPGIEAPMVIRKQDGAFLYATTDLATIAYRVQKWQPDVILYVVDHRQSLHFEQLFAATKLWGQSNLQLVHVSFGTVLGDDGKPFKTRSGDTVGLVGLLDEAVRRALAIISEPTRPTSTLPEEQRQRIAEIVGIGALKYADLSQNRTSDYVFSYDKMLAMDGNTATYMQYAYARVSSIFAKGEIDPARIRSGEITLNHPAERALAVSLLRFVEGLEMVVSDFRPNHLTSYLYELANCYSSFFEQCPVLKAETPELRNSRLRLCDLTARTIEQGLSLLGIGVPEKM
jgi:arginyl-tRNA synthetase